MSAHAPLEMKPAVAPPVQTPTPAPFGTLQRKCACGGSGGSSGSSGSSGDCSECKKKKTLQRRATSGAQAGIAPPIVHEVLRSPGQPLEAQTRSFFEPRFGHDFSRVRIHADARANASAHSVNALAYTVGCNIVFAPEQYRPATPPGRRLLAHELAHVVQQSAGISANQNGIQRSTAITGSSSLTIGASDSPAEREANTAAAAAQMGSAIYNVSWRPVELARQQAAADPTPPTSPQSSATQPQGNYGHDVATCQESDLKSHIWPGNDLARNMVNRAVQLLDTAQNQPTIKALLKRYFMTETPDIAAIKRIFSVIQSEFVNGGYFFSCLEDCASSEKTKTLGVTKVYWIVGPKGPVYLCMNNLRSLAVSFTAETILHEFGHRYANLNDVDVYCDTGACPASLSAQDALKNPDSYSEFAADVYSKSLYVKELKGIAPQG